MRTFNLPQQTMSFIGREQEITEVCVLLDDADCRLLSLIGPGGMGKTRLSLEIARCKLADFADGAYFVALQSLVSPESIVSTIASAINFDFESSDDSLQEQLLEYLEDKNMLLLLDNFEHLLSGAELVSDMLARAPELKVLVTSREALKLRQEWIHPLSGMRFPENGQLTDIENYSAVQLFIERAQQLRRNFSVEDELPHIVRICQLVGGMPLAIELAVAWLNTLSCAEIASEIQKCADLLTAQVRDIPQRHQSIRAVFNSTWERLNAEEQAVFMRLSIFRSMPTRQVIQAVTGASLMVLSGLADKALLTPAEDGRYHIHELLRQYAYEKLEESDELDKIKDAHSEYYLCLMKDLLPDLQGHRQIAALDEITLEFENIRLAWFRALELLNYDAIAGAVESLCSYLHFRSRWKHDSAMVIQAQEALENQKGEKARRVWAMVLARNYMNNSDPELALNQALTVAREYNDRGEIGLYLHLLGHVQSHNENRREAIRYFEEGIPYFQEAGNQYHVAAALGFAGINYRLIGDYETSVEYTEKSLELRRAIGDIDGQGFAIAELASLMFTLGNLQEAERYLQETRLLAQQTGRLSSIAWAEWEIAVYHSFGVKGDLQAIHESIEKARIGLDGFPKVRSHYAPGALSKSITYSLEGNYDEARRYGEESLSLAENDPWSPYHAWGLMMAACGQEDFDTVQEHTSILLRHFVDLRIVPLIFLGITFSSVLAAYREKNPRYATELLALVSTHPSSMSGWLNCWPFIAHLQEHLKNELGTEAYRAAWERGKNLEWETVVSGLISEYGREDTNNESAIPAHILEANAALFEPLSDRELEVLLKIAEGHSNTEIAEQLFVGVSTVKKHITHIYGKLGVETRTQALIKAQELNLV